MGDNNSSKTRVVPIFDTLLKRDPTGETWLNEILSLDSLPQPITSLPDRQRLVANHGARWGSNEYSLPSPAGLLEHLVHSITLEQVAKNDDSADVLRRRQALANKDADTLDEALRELRAGKRGKHWFVLEGESRPDALLETDELVLVIEGKRTEKTCTTSTTWMACRSQLLRHMDTAKEAFPGKRILGMLVVEGDGDADAVEPSAHWRRQLDEQVASTMVDGSLPHRTADEKNEIVSGVLGVTTWQAICSRLSVPWPPA